VLQWVGLRAFNSPVVACDAVPAEFTVQLTPALQSIIHNKQRLQERPCCEEQCQEEKMTNPALLVSTPPQHQPNFEVAAPVFWLSAIELRMKANYNIPEIWFADSDDDAISATAEYLKESGFRFCVMHGQDIADVPNQQSVQAFSFEDSSLVLNLGHTELKVEYDSPVFAILCQPQAKDKGQVADRNTEVSKRTPFLDIITTQGGKLGRASVFETVADFSGLPETPKDSADNLAMLVAELENRFTQKRVDKRLVGMRLRDKQTISAVPGQDPDRERKRYSYATRELANLLESITADLKDISQPDLSSRLIYLTGR
jgi:hypothetical protein